jgi:hypothetical protein
MYEVLTTARLNTLQFSIELLEHEEGLLFADQSRLNAKASETEF